MEPVSTGDSSVQFTSAPADEAFAREIFLLRQKVFTFNAKYMVADRNKQPILFVERPAHLGRNLLAIFAGMFAGLCTMIGLLVLSNAHFHVTGRCVHESQYRFRA